MDVDQQYEPEPEGSKNTYALQLLVCQGEHALLCKSFVRVRSYEGHVQYVCETTSREGRLKFERGAKKR